MEPTTFLSQETAYSEEWGDLTYHLSKPRLPNKSSLTELLKTDGIGLLASEISSIEGAHMGDAKAMLNKQRMLWTQGLHNGAGQTYEDQFSESSSDEGGEFISQREKIRNKSQNLTHEQQQHMQRQQQQLELESRFLGPHGSSTDSFEEEEGGGEDDAHSIHSSSGNSSGSSHRKEHLSRMQAYASAGGSSQGIPSVPLKSPSRHWQQHRSRSNVRGAGPPPVPLAAKFGTVIEIRDYDFDRRNIIVPAGVPIDFCLHPEDVPLHVEHVLEGRSLCPDLCFTSPILQVRAFVSFGYFLY